MHQQDRLARSGWTLEGCGGDTDDHSPTVEVRKHVAQGERALHRVELVSRFDKPRGGPGIEIRAEGDNHHVAFETASVGLDAACCRVDRSDGGLHEAHTGLDQVTVGMAYRLRHGAPEHDVELGEAEHKSVGLVDQHDLDLVAELF